MCSQSTLRGSRGTVLPFGVGHQSVTDVGTDADVHNMMKCPPVLVLTLTMAPNAAGEVEGIQRKVQPAPQPGVSQYSRLTMHLPAASLSDLGDGR